MDVSSVNKMNLKVTPNLLFTGKSSENAIGAKRTHTIEFL